MTEPETGSPARAHIGRYEILRELGRGGMAVVYLARQPDLDRFVALKEMAAFGMHDPKMVHRFVREAQIAGSLSDPNIVTVHDSFVSDGVPYIAMEYLAPGSLRPLVGALRVDQSVAVLHDVLSGLMAAERRGIVHRDLKPENLLLTEGGRVKIADFGIAKAVDRVATTEFKTAAGTTVGTPTYMAPEQAMGQPLTPAADLYSVGVMAYELMVGRLPFEAESPVALLLQHVSDPPPPPLTVNPALDPELAAWIERLLVKEPASRTGSAAQAWDELEDIVVRLYGHRWRRAANLPDPRTFHEPPPEPVEEEPSGYLTVDPSRFEPGRPPVGGTDAQPTAVSREPAAPPPAEYAPPAPWTPPPEEASAVPGPWTPPPDDAVPPPSGPPRAVPTAWAPPPPRGTPPPLDATVAPSHPLPTPAPLETPKAPRRGLRRVVWVGGLVALGTVAAVFAILVRPSGEEPAAPTPTASPGSTARPPRDFATNAFTLRLPAEWSMRCLEASRCGRDRLPAGQFRSAFVRRSGVVRNTLTIDHTQLPASSPSVTPTSVAGRVDEQLVNLLSGYERAAGTPRAVTTPHGRAMLLSFTSDDPQRRAGTVYVFKDGAKDVYVVTATAPDPQDAAALAEDAVGALQLR